MDTIYLVNILHKILIYSKYIYSVTIISTLFMLIIIFYYTCNIIINIYWKYTFVNFNIPNYIAWNTQMTPLYLHWVATKLVIFAINET